MTNPLDSYINCTRFVFSVEPTEPSEEWHEFDDFEHKLREFYDSILCCNCKNLLKDPCTPKKQHFSCQHRVCLDCIGKNRQTTSTNCKMCRDFTLFEKSTQTKLILGLYQELCELIKGSWIYDYIQQRNTLDTGQNHSMSLVEMIDKGVNYGQNISIIVDDSSSSSSSSPQSSGDDENSNSSDVKQNQSSDRPISIPQIFPKISPLQSISPTNSNCNSISSVQSSDQIITPIVTAAANLPNISTSANINQNLVAQPSSSILSQSSTSPLPISAQPAPMVIQSQQLPNTLTKQSSTNHPLLKTSSFISQMRVKSITQTTTPMNTKSLMSPMKIQQTAPPTIYSVMYTGSGNKITLKRKTPDESSSSSLSVSSTPSSEIKNISNNTNFLKTENKNSNFKTPSVQVVSTTGMIHQQSHQIPIVVPTSTAPVVNLNTTTTPSSQLTNNISNNSSNDQQKRRGCRCGNATAAPGKLTCCGQRCPCYVDSKACIDCKCRGCRNPHYVDGHKKMRHQVPDLQMQQQQQQNFLASIQQQTAIMKEAQKSIVPTSLIKSEEMNLIEPTIITKSQNSINNCIISMNSNGQYQIKPRIIMKDSTKATMSPLIFPTATSSTIGNSNNSSIQIVGLYSQVPMANDKKIIIKNEIPTTTSNITTFTDQSRQQHLLESNASFTTNNLNTGML
ncbi:hypothetical protein PVAND_004449 [Polypedilum vanderplanki]|uniref:RING-type domain-containing protein n=1 Tax=Polypedilum vanderplanki TaxID=319348 RepID=A0A9J6BX06_POLVA|nr:hypothetical protein PVAND_004449 [Polypedilum vanderplanki]